MVHSKSTWWGTIPPDGITGGQPVEEIRRRTPAPFLSEGEKEAMWGKNCEWVWGVRTPPARPYPHALEPAR